MSETLNEEKSRREFFRGIGRNLALGGIAVLAAALTGRRANRREQQCLNRGVCRGCGSFEDCGLPQALSARQGMGE